MRDGTRWEVSTRDGKLLVRTSSPYMNDHEAFIADLTPWLKTKPDEGLGYANLIATSPELLNVAGAVDMFYGDRRPIWPEDRMERWRALTGKQAVNEYSLRDFAREVLAKAASLGSGGEK